VKQLVDWLVSYAVVYDAVQYLVGAQQVRQLIAVQASRLPRPRRVLDVGGGTGVMRGIWPTDAMYVSLDVDTQKLSGFRQKFPDDGVMLADGTAIPVLDETFDVVIMTFVTHHLDDAALHRALHEIERVLKSGGSLLVVDPVWVASRWRGRLLWRYDQGSYPRTAERLQSLISQIFPLKSVETFAVHHAYACYWGEKRV
jgi:ubiquinone/menaquinone biosynthesis C-methylase UbiE